MAGKVALVLNGRELSTRGVLGVLSVARRAAVHLKDSRSPSLTAMSTPSYPNPSLEQRFPEFRLHF